MKLSPSFSIAISIFLFICMAWGLSEDTISYGMGMGTLAVLNLTLGLYNNDK